MVISVADGNKGGGRKKSPLCYYILLRLQKTLYICCAIELFLNMSFLKSRTLNRVLGFFVCCFVFYQTCLDLSVSLGAISSLYSFFLEKKTVLASTCNSIYWIKSECGSHRRWPPNYMSPHPCPLVWNAGAMLLDLGDLTDINWRM